MKKFISIFIPIMLVFCFSSSAFALDKTKEAQKLYNQAIKVQDANPAEAIKLLTKAIAYNPKNPEYYFQRGFIEPNYGKAILDYERAVVLNPDKYYSKCFGTSLDGNKIMTNFNSMTFNTNWKRQSSASNTLTEIKNYLATYKGDKLKNAKSIIDTATNEYLVMLEAEAPNGSAYADVALIPDYKNECPDPETYISGVSQSLSEDSDVTDISDIKITEIDGLELAYVDYTGLLENGSKISCRHYTAAFDYYIVSIRIAASDKNALESAAKDFVNTLTMD